MPMIMKKRTFAHNAAVDYPKQNERIAWPFYTVRVSAPEGAKCAEVCIDQGHWAPCRSAVGHWWYDWSGYDNGEHEIIARVTTQDGRVIRTEPREFFVVPKTGSAVK